MVNIYGKMCAHPKCSKNPSFGVAGTKRREFCSEHAEIGMVNIYGPCRCAHPGCCKYPSFGTAGTKKAEFCREHAKVGMVNLHSKKCAHPKCSKYPSFGVAGTKRREFCAGHAKDGMVPVRAAADDANSIIVKAEGIVLSSGLLASEGSGVAGSTTIGIGRNRRSSRSSVRSDVGATSPGHRTKREGRKRARRAVDDDVVVLEAGDGKFPATNEGVAHGRKGASVAIKPEQ
eukprot:g15791.t1